MMASLQFLFMAAIKDLRRLWRDPLGLIMCLSMPFVITVLVSLIFGGDNPTPKGTLLIVDDDDTFLSSAMRNAFTQGPLGKMVIVEMVKADDGQARISRGDASGLLFVPKGFQQALLKNEKCELRLLTNPAQRILPGIIKESLSVLADAEFYVQAMFGDQIRKFADRPPTELEIAEFSVMGKRLGEKLQQFIDPPIIKLETTTTVEKKEQESLGVLFFPGMLLFGVMLLGQTMSGDIWKEKSGGTLRRTLTTSAQFWAFLAGKVLSATAIMIIVAMLGLLCARLLVHMHIAAPLSAIAWVSAVGSVMFLVMLVVNIVGSSERGANVLTSIVVFLFAMIGGGMFPFEMMPDWLVKIGSWTPNGWASIEFKEILAGTADLRRLAVAATALVGLGVLAFAVAAKSLRRFALK